MHGGSSAHKQQRYGSYWQGDDRELEHTLHVGVGRAVAMVNAGGSRGNEHGITHL